MMDYRELDDVVTLAAERTQRNVSLDDVTGRVLAYSTIAPTADRTRIDAVLLKEVPSETRNWEELHGVSSRTRAFRVPGDPKHDVLPRICVPLLVRGVRVGYLWILANSEEDDLSSILEQLDRWRAGTDRLAERVLVALDRSGGASRQADANLRELITGESEHARDDLARVFERDDEPVLLAFSGEGSEEAGDPLPALAYTHAIDDASRSSGLETVGFADEQHGVCLLPGGAGVDDFVERIGQALRLRTTSGHDRALHYGASSPLTDSRDCRTAYRQAIVALQAAAVDPGLRSHCYADAGIYQLLDQLGSTRVPPRIEKLRETEGGPEKLRFLERVYDSPGPMQRVAEGLHMHRTSIYNHLQRIERTIGADPLDPLARLELHAGLKMLRWTRRPRFAPLRRMGRTPESADGR